jgi:hypothetical protein
MIVADFRCPPGVIFAMKSVNSRGLGEMVTFKELLARVHAIRRRTEARQDIAMAGPIQVFFVATIPG